MANRRAEKKPNSNNRFVIPGQNKDDKHIEIDMGKNDTTNNAVIVKDLDPNLPLQYTFIEGGVEQTISVKWLTAFGISKSSARNLDQYVNGITYTVELDAIPKGSRLFLYYDGQIYEQSFTASGNRISFQLSRGDPPIGFGP
jgi:hypothetical protein